MGDALMILYSNPKMKFLMRIMNSRSRMPIRILNLKLIDRKDKQAISVH